MRRGYLRHRGVQQGKTSALHDVVSTTMGFLFLFSLCNAPSATAANVLDCQAACESWGAQAYDSTILPVTGVRGNQNQDFTFCYCRSGTTSNPGTHSACIQAIDCLTGQTHDPRATCKGAYSSFAYLNVQSSVCQQSSQVVNVNTESPELKKLLQTTKDAAVIKAKYLAEAKKFDEQKSSCLKDDPGCVDVARAGAAFNRKMADGIAKCINEGGCYVKDGKVMAGKDPSSADPTKKNQAADTPAAAPNVAAKAAKPNLSPADTAKLADLTQKAKDAEQNATIKNNTLAEAKQEKASLQQDFDKNNCDGNTGDPGGNDAKCMQIRDAMGAADEKIRNADAASDNANYAAGDAQGKLAKSKADLGADADAPGASPTGLVNVPKAAGKGSSGGDDAPHEFSAADADKWASGSRGSGSGDEGGKQKKEKEDTGDATQINDPCQIGAYGELARKHKAEFGNSASITNTKAWREWLKNPDHTTEVQDALDKHGCDSAKSTIDGIQSAGLGMQIAAGAAGSAAAGASTASVQNQYAQNPNNLIALQKAALKSSADALEGTATVQMVTAVAQVGLAIGAGKVKSQQEDDAKTDKQLAGDGNMLLKCDENDQNCDNRKIALKAAGLAHFGAEQDDGASGREANTAGTTALNNAAKEHQALADKASAAEMSNAMMAAVGLAGGVSKIIQAEQLRQEENLLIAQTAAPTMAIQAGAGGVINQGTPPPVMQPGISGANAAPVTPAANSLDAGTAPPAILPSAYDKGIPTASLKDAPIAQTGGTYTPGTSSGGGGGGGSLSGGGGSGSPDAADKPSGAEAYNSAPTKFEGTGGGSAFSAVANSGKKQDTGAVSGNPLDALLAALMPNKDKLAKEDGDITKRQGSRGPAGLEDDGSILGPNSTFWPRASRVFTQAYASGRVK